MEHAVQTTGATSHGIQMSILPKIKVMAATLTCDKLAMGLRYDPASQVTAIVPSACPVGISSSTCQSFSSQPSRFYPAALSFFVFDSRFLPLSDILSSRHRLLWPFSGAPRRTTAFRFLRDPATPYPAVPSPASPQTHRSQPRLRRVSVPTNDRVGDRGCTRCESRATPARSVRDSSWVQSPVPSSRFR